MLKITITMVKKRFKLFNYQLSIINFQLTILCLFASLLICPNSYASDFILPNTSGEPVVIDVSSLNLNLGTNVNIGDFKDQPRPYRDGNVTSLSIVSPAVSSGEKTIEIRSGSALITKTISFRSSPSGNLKNSLLPNIKQGRGGNTTTKISDGRVLLIGGSKSLATDPIDTVEIFNPEVGVTEYLKNTNELSKVTLKTPRSQHTATYLGITNLPIGMITGPVEQILLAGGFSKDGNLDSTLEVLEIRVGTNQATSTLLSSKNAKLKKARIFHTASLLPDGRVIIVGGQGRISKTNLGALNSIEIYDPVLMTVQPSGIVLSTSRLLHTATTLQNGNILIAGGFTNQKQTDFIFGPATEKAELINVSNLTVKNVSDMKEKTGGQSATLLTNGLVLLLGGNADFFSSRNKDELRGLSKGTIQFFNPNDETFNIALEKVSGANLELQVPRFLHKSVLLPNGSVAVVGGLNIKAGTNSSSFVFTPVTTIEVYEPNLSTFSGSSLKIEKKTFLESSAGRILPTAVLVTPKNKTQGFFSSADLNKFVNCGIYVTGGFTNGLGQLPSKTTELLQIESNNKIEGRDIKTTPEALIQGGYSNQYLIQLNQFSKVPALKVEPQTVNLSSSNEFRANLKILSTNNQVVLVRANTDSSSSIIVSPSLFQVGDTVSISRKDSSISGEFDLSFVSGDESNEFIPAKVKVNISDSAKPFLATEPGFGISLSTQEGNNSDKIKIKVLSQDGITEFSSIPPTTSITAKIENPELANLGGAGISSVTGTLSTQYNINALKPGKTNINFSIEPSSGLEDILSVSIPVEITGTPTFLNEPIDTQVLNLFSQNGLDFSKTNILSSNSVSIDDLRLSSTSSLFPFYIPINLQSSINGSTIQGLFTIRPIYGIDLFNAVPRTLVNKAGSDFRNPLTILPSAIGGILSQSTIPTAFVASDDGIRSLDYSQSVSDNLSESFIKVNGLSGVKVLKPIEVAGVIKLLALKDEKLYLINSISGDIESLITLSGNGFELGLTTINGQLAAIVSVGQKGVDVIFSVTEKNPRVVNFKLPGDTKHISVIGKLGDNAGPFVAAYDGVGVLSLLNVVDVNAAVQTIDVSREKLSKTSYVGRYTVGGKVTDVLVASGDRKLLLYDLNNKTNIPISNSLKIKTQIKDLVVIGGIAYVALGTSGIVGASIGSLIEVNNSKSVKVAEFKKNKLRLLKSDGRILTKSKPLNAIKLVDSNPFLLATGEGNNLTVIRVLP